MPSKIPIFLGRIIYKSHLLEEPASRHFINFTVPRKILWIFSLFGFMTLLLVLVISPVLLDYWQRLNEFDDQAWTVYSELGDKLIRSGNPAEATVWMVPVQAGLSIAEVEESMDAVAAEYNLRRAGQTELFPMEKRHEVEKFTGVPFRYSKTIFYCNATTAAKMFNHNIAYSAYTPCRITLIEDDKGDFWLVSLNIDMMIYGGKPLPPELKVAAMNVREGIRNIMLKGAAGEF